MVAAVGREEAIGLFCGGGGGGGGTALLAAFGIYKLGEWFEEMKMNAKIEYKRWIHSNNSSSDWN